MILYILLSGLIVSSGSLIGIFTLSLNQHRLNKILMLLVSLSAGSLMGGAFLHLFPEAIETLGSEQAFRTALIAYILFFIIESFLHWHHCHDNECETHSFGYMNLIGDSVHNFIDGLIIAGSFMTDFNLGIITSLAVAMHEIPQEIGDFGVLLHAGFKTKKALMLNFIVALMIIPGSIVGFILSSSISDIIPHLLPFAAGGFLYISSTDLVPQLRDQNSLKKSLSNLILFIVGLMLMLSLKFIELS